MTEGDAKRAAALEAENFSEPWTENAFLDTLCLDYAYYYVAEIDETTAGKEKLEKLEKPLEREEQPEGEDSLQRNEEKVRPEETHTIIGICGLRLIAGGRGKSPNVSVDRHYRKKGNSRSHAWLCA